MSLAGGFSTVVKAVCTEPLALSTGSDPLLTDSELQENGNSAGNANASGNGNSGANPSDSSTSESSSTLAFTGPGGGCTGGSTPNTPSSISYPSTSTSGSFTVSWGASEGFTGVIAKYHLEQSKNGGGYTEIATIAATTTSYSLTGRGYGDYRYRVRACKDGLCSGYRTGGTILVRPKPAKPATPVNVNSTATSYRVSWTKPSGTVSYYQVQEKLVSGNWATISSKHTATYIDLSGKLNNQAWNYRVRACNGYNWACSSYSSANTVRVELKPSVPTAPLNVNSASSSFSISWTKPSGSVNFYKVQERVAGGSWSTVSSNNTTTSLSFSGRANNTNYEYKVAACNSYDWACSDFSPVNLVRVEVKPEAPAKPTDINSTSTIFSVAWSKPSGTADYYYIRERTLGGSWSPEVKLTAASYPRTHSDGSTWEYQVKACNSFDWACSSFSPTAVAKVRIPAEIPGKQDNVYSNTSSYSVEWTAAARATYYYVQERAVGSTWGPLNKTSATSQTFTNNNNTYWEYQVKACNGEDWACSSFGPTISATVRFKPGTPAAPTTSVTQSITGSYSINWTAPTGTTTKYDLQQRKDNGGWATIANNTTSTTKAVSGLSSGDYQYRVRACNTYDWACSSYSVISNNVMVRLTPGKPSITQPTGNIVKYAQFPIKWGADAEATYYVVEELTGSGAWDVLANNLAATTYEISKSASGTYNFRVKACNELSCSAYSNTKTITLVLPPTYGEVTLQPVADAIFSPLGNIPAQQNVGALEGQAGVSGGAATYSVPIAIPPGRAGMQPNVSLNYSSRSGNGIVGVGWSLGVGSSIHRCGPSRAVDGQNVGVTYNATMDKLCLDGQRLILANSAAYGEPGAQYHTELDQFLRVTQLDGSMNSGSTNFKVEYKNGTLAYYGNSSDSRHSAGGISETLSWAIKQKEDRTPLRNNIRYYYETYGQGEHLLRQIKYTGENDSYGDRQVEFVYENRPDKDFKMLAGGKTESTKRLSHIKTYLNNGNLLIRDYAINYQNTTKTVSEVSRRSLVRNIVECSQNQCLPATNFTWEDVAPSMGAKKQFNTYTGDYNLALFGRDALNLTDVNGDGIKDAVIYDHLNPNSTTWERKVTVRLLNAAGELDTEKYYDNPIDLGTTNFNTVGADFNLDGYKDFIYYDYSSDQTKARSFKKSIVGGKEKWTYSGEVVTLITGPVKNVIDLNGDGKEDLITTDGTNYFAHFNTSKMTGGVASISFSAPQVMTHVNPNVRGHAYLSVMNIDMSSLFAFGAPPPPVVPFGPVLEQESMGTSDINGDGLVDLIFTREKNKEVTFNYEKSEFYPDGLVQKTAVPERIYHEIVFARPNGSGGVSYDARVPGEQLGLPYNIAFNQGVFADINGDGLADYASAEVISGQYRWMVRYNNGNGTFANSVNTGIATGIHTQTYDDDPLNDDIFKHRVQAVNGGLMVMDIDQDGDDELLVAEFPIGSVTYQSSHYNSMNIRRTGTGLHRFGDKSVEPYAFHSTYSAYDIRPYNYSVVDIRSGSNRVISNYLKAPLPYSVQGGLEIGDVNSDGYTDISYKQAKYFCVDSLDLNCDNIDKGDSWKTETRIEVSSSFSDTAALYYHQGEKASPDLLQEVENGLGVHSRWNYAPLVSDGGRSAQDPKFYEIPTDRYVMRNGFNYSEDYLYFASSMYVVSDFEQSNGIGEFNKTAYSYREAIYNREGRGFQGFRTIIVDNPDGTRAVTDFHQVFPLAGKIEEVRTCMANDDNYGHQSEDNSNVNVECNNSPLSKNAFEYFVFKKKYSEPTSGFSGRTRICPEGDLEGDECPSGDDDTLRASYNNYWWVVPTESTELSYDFNDRDSVLPLLNKKVTLDPLQDVDAAFGNILKTTQVIDDGYSQRQTVTENSYYPENIEGWWINKLEWTKVTSQTLSGSKNAVYDATLDPVKWTKTTINSYDPLGSRHPASITTTAIDAKSVTVNSIYNNTGLPTKVTTTADGESREVNTGYSSDGYFVEWVNSGLGRAYSYADPIHGQPERTKDINSLETNYKYDAFGRAEQVTPPNGSGQPVYTRFAWCENDCDGRGFPTDVASRMVYKQTSYSAGTPESIVYKDQFNRVVASATKAFDGSNYVYTTAVYDALGRKVRETNPSHDASFAKGVHFDKYDEIGRLTEKRVDQADNQEMAVSYIYAGHDTTIKASGLIMHRTYSGNGQLMKTVDAESGVTQYAYDAMGNPIVLQDANGSPITASYNGLGQKKYVIDPNMGRKDFTYTGFGEVKTETDANGNSYRYKYDTQGRLTHRYLNGWDYGDLEARFLFDSANQGTTGAKCKGLPESELSKNGNNFARSYAYDSLCRPLQTTTSIDGRSFVQTTHYDTNYGRVKGVTYPTGTTLENWYNSDGYLTHQVNAANDYVYHEVTAADARGQVLRALKANGNLTEKRVFDDVSGQMLEVYTYSNTVLDQRHRIVYTYDNGFGNLRSQDVESIDTNGVVSSLTETYRYDDLHRLVESTLNGVSTGYDYDKVGNLLYKDDFASNYLYGDIARTYNNAGPNAVRQVTKAGGGTVTYSYDANGNLLSDGEKTLTYNAFNKPTKITKSGITSNFYYGSDQMRFKQVKTGKAGGTETTYYVGKAYEEIHYNGEIIKKSYMGDTILTETERNNNLDFKIGFVHRDRLNSVVTITDENGRIVDNKSYDPFGKPRKASMEKVDLASPARLDQIAWMENYIPTKESTELHTRRGFTDHEHLDDAELIHMNGRVYDYNLGRFLSVDPFIQEPGNSQSMNPYSYIMNNPLAGTDPSGYTACDAGDDSCDKPKEKPKRKKRDHRRGKGFGWKTVYVAGNNGSDTTNATVVVKHKGKAPENIGDIKTEDVISITIISDTATEADLVAAYSGGTEEESFDFDCDGCKFTPGQYGLSGKRGGKPRRVRPQSQETQEIFNIHQYEMLVSQIQLINPHYRPPPNASSYNSPLVTQQTLSNLRVVLQNSINALAGRAPIQIGNTTGRMQPKSGYTQVQYTWVGSDNLVYIARWHGRTGEWGPAHSWRVTRGTSKNQINRGNGEEMYNVFGAHRWVSTREYRSAIRARRAGTATGHQRFILKRSHMP
nr:fibronectin type III domain-containing protein [Aliikangiella sp. G2MR2-5]